MNIKSVTENKEKYEVELVIEVDGATFEAAVEKVYKETRKSINIPGFRKGKAPRKVIEGMYGTSVFYEDALKEIYPDAVADAVAEQKLDIVATPKIEIENVGKDGVTIKAICTIRPIVELKDYKGLQADKVITPISDAAIDAELQKYVDRATSTQPVERGAAMGDTACIDYQGLKDGVPFDGGTAEGYDLVLGSGSFIPGFEEQVVGMSAGEEKDINLTFPENYHAEELKGQPVVFKVKCVEVKEKKVPAIDDEFAKDVSEFDTLEEFRADIKAKLAERGLTQSETNFRKTLVTLLTEQITIDIPEAMIEAKVDDILEGYSKRLEQQGISMEMYLAYMQTTVEAVREEMKEGAISQIKQEMVLDSVAAAEGIVISDEEIEAEIKKAVEQLQIPYEKAVEGLDKEGLRRDMARDRALTVISTNAKPNLITVDPTEIGDIEVTEVTKD